MKSARSGMLDAQERGRRRSGLPRWAHWVAIAGTVATYAAIIMIGWQVGSFVGKVLVFLFETLVQP